MKKLIAGSLIGGVLIAYLTWQLGRPIEYMDAVTHETVVTSKYEFVKDSLGFFVWDWNNYGEGWRATECSSVEEPKPVTVSCEVMRVRVAADHAGSLLLAIIVD